jgi:putative nucleotidyltransferase with HDIG domain
LDRISRWNRAIAAPVPDIQFSDVYRPILRALDLDVDGAALEHARRVQRNAWVLADAMGVTDRELLETIAAAGLLHDVGKMAVPEHLLNKPGPLDAREFEQVKQHAAIGAGILTALHSPLELVAIVRHHHENWNGTGYPDGLRGRAIPIGARVLCIIDCYDALTSDRPYRRAMSRGRAVELIAACRGTMYDPAVLDAFLSVQPQLPCAADGGVFDAGTEASTT